MQRIHILLDTRSVHYSLLCTLVLASFCFFLFWIWFCVCHSVSTISIIVFVLKVNAGTAIIKLTAVLQWRIFYRAFFDRVVLLLLFSFLFWVFVQSSRAFAFILLHVALCDVKNKTERRWNTGGIKKEWNAAEWCKNRTVQHFAALAFSQHFRISPTSFNAASCCVWLLEMLQRPAAAFCSVSCPANARYIFLRFRCKLNSGISGQSGRKAVSLGQTNARLTDKKWREARQALKEAGMLARCCSNRVREPANLEIC